MKQLVINADDLGMCRGANLAILRAHREGVVTSASLMANLPAFDHAVEHVAGECSNLGLGIHLNLTCGKPVLPAHRVPLLVDRAGAFRGGFAWLYRLAMHSRLRHEALEQVVAELRAQFERVRFALAAVGGTALDHVNGHQHVHTIPAVWDVVLGLTEEFDAGAVRISRERWSGRGGQTWAGALARGNLLKQQLLARLSESNLQRTNEPWQRRRLHPDVNLVGILDSGRLDEPTLLARLEGVPDGRTEILIHPSYGNEPQSTAASDLDELGPSDRRFQREPWRQRELAALCSAAVRQRIEQLGIQLTTFREMNGSPPQPATSLASP